MKEFLGRKQHGCGCFLGFCWPLAASLVHSGCSYRCSLCQVRAYTCVLSEIDTLTARANSTSKCGDVEGKLCWCAGLYGMPPLCPSFLVAVLEEPPVAPTSSSTPNHTAFNVTITPSSNTTTTPPAAPTGSAIGHIWQGVAFLLQNIFIFLRYISVKCRYSHFASLVALLTASLIHS